MQKWEYAVLKLHGTTEFWVYLPNGEKKKILNTWSLAEVLTWFGDAGWEAVNFLADEHSLSSMAMYSKFPLIWGEILFKRPKE